MRAFQTVVAAKWLRWNGKSSNYQLARCIFCQKIDSNQVWVPSETTQLWTFQTRTEFVLICPRPWTIFILPIIGKHFVNRDRLKQTHEKMFSLSDKHRNCRGRLKPISEQVKARKTYQWSDSWKKQRSLILILVFFFLWKLFCGDAIYCWWMWWLLQFNIPDMFLVSCCVLSLWPCLFSFLQWMCLRTRIIMIFAQVFSIIFYVACFVAVFSIFSLPSI